MSTPQLKNVDLYHPSASQASRQAGVIADHAPPASAQSVVSEVGVIAQHAPPAPSQRVVSEDGPLGTLLKEYTLALGRYYLNDADSSVDKASNVCSLHDTVAGLLQWLRTHGYREHWLVEEAAAVVQSSRDHAERLARGDDQGSRENQGEAEPCFSQFSLREFSLNDHLGRGSQGYAEGEYYPPRRHSAPDAKDHWEGQQRRPRYDTYRPRGDCYRPRYD